jgi:hypothetical protein
MTGEVLFGRADRTRLLTPTLQDVAAFPDRRSAESWGMRQPGPQKITPVEMRALGLRGPHRRNI